MKKNPFAALEIAVVFFLILAQIWYVGKVLTPVTLLPLAVIATSWLTHRETFQSLGLARFSIKGHQALWTIVAIGVVVVASVGIVANRSILSREDFVIGLPLRFISYLLPALAQQIILNGFFVNRIQSLTSRRNMTAMIAGILFCLIHAPNPVLLVLTLFGGTICAYFFIGNRNVCPLAIAHAALAAVTYCTLPQMWHHGFRVGMEYGLFVPKTGDCCTPEFLKMLLP